MDALQKSSDVLEIRQSAICSSANVEETKVDVASIDVLSMPLLDKTPILSNMLGHAMHTGRVRPEWGYTKRKPEFKKDNSGSFNRNRNIF